jgi:hypothetical protein
MSRVGVEPWVKDALNRMALVSVLWGMTLLAIIAASFLSAGNTSYQLARNAVELAEADALGEAAVNSRGVGAA